MSKLKDSVGAILFGIVIGVSVAGPKLYQDYKDYKAHQREFLEIELKSLKSEYGVCDVLMNSDRKDLQDIMRDVCDKNLARQAELNKELGQ